MALDTTATTAVVGAADGASAVWSIAEKVALSGSNGEGSGIHDVLALDDSISIIATASGEVAILKQGDKVASFTSHSGPAIGLALHPSGTIVASVGYKDKSVVLYDVAQSREIAKIITDSSKSRKWLILHRIANDIPELTCCQFHPDGHLLAVGTTSGQIKVFDAKSSTLAATFELSNSIRSISFSENGFWLAAAVSGSSTVSIWDLRKAAEIKTLDFGGPVDHVRFDYTGQFLVGAGQAGLTVQYYDKSAKTWSEPLRRALSASAVEWGPQGKSLVVLTTDGAITVLQ